ncbi:MAG: hypothetical protein QM831_09835 [Kofleriaceae bacterium]
MRALLLVVLFAGCQQRKEPTPAPATPVKPVAIDAPMAVVVDAEAPADADTTYAILDAESFGGLKMWALDTDVIKVLGAPKKKSKAEMEGATGSYVSMWDWSGASAKMSGDSEKGPFKLAMLTISKGSKLETAKHIKIGSPRADVEKAYPRSDDDQKDDKNRYLSGSVYGGVMFTFEKDKVSSVSMGAFAF